MLEKLVEKPKEEKKERMEALALTDFSEVVFKK
jgi:hypothetical protein